MIEYKDNKQSLEGNCSGWTAWHNFMPGSVPALHVKGSCEFRTDGYSVELRPMVSQGINPSIYLLERIVHPPTGPVNEVLTTEEVHYVEETSKKYTHVQIYPSDELIEVSLVV